MRVSELVTKLNLKETYHTWPDKEVKGAYTSDLLSDVMANAQEGQALITIQAHKNAVATASLVGASCIIICNQRPIPEDMIASAKSEGLPLLLSSENQYTLSGKLYLIEQEA